MYENHKFARVQTISGNCGTHIIVQVGYITIETKEAAYIGHSTFLFVYLGFHLSGQAEKEPRYVQHGPLLLSQ
jgi:hypothetical protein